MHNNKFMLIIKKTSIILSFTLVAHFLIQMGIPKDSEIHIPFASTVSMILLISLLTYLIKTIQSE